MKDFRIVSARILLTIQSVAPVRRFIPPSIIAIGNNLNKASEIFYNNSKVDEFAILSPTRLLIKIPDSQIGKNFNGLQVYSDVPNIGSSLAISLALNKPPQIIEGIDRLIQSWLLIFLTTPGSSIFSPQSGGSGNSIIGRVTDSKGKGVSADLAIAIDRTKSELLSLQSKKQNIPLSEKLLSSSLESLNFDASTSTLSATVSIVNMLGNKAEVSIGQ